MFLILRGAEPASMLEVGFGLSTHIVSAAAPEAPFRCVDPVPRSDISSLDISLHQGVPIEAQCAFLQELPRARWRSMIPARCWCMSVTSFYRMPIRRSGRTLAAQSSRGRAADTPAELMR